MVESGWKSLRDYSWKQLGEVSKSCKRRELSLDRWKETDSNGWLQSEEEVKVSTLTSFSLTSALLSANDDILFEN